MQICIICDVRSFVRLLLQAEAQPTLNLSAETIYDIAVQYTYPGRGRELVGVCDVC